MGLATGQGLRISGLGNSLGNLGLRGDRVRPRLAGGEPGTPAARGAQCSRTPRALQRGRGWGECVEGT